MTRCLYASSASADPRFPAQTRIAGAPNVFTVAITSGNAAGSSSPSRRYDPYAATLKPASAVIAPTSPAREKSPTGTCTSPPHSIARKPVSTARSTIARGPSLRKLTLTNPGTKATPAPLPRKSSRVLVGSGARGDRRDPRDASSLSFCVFPFRISFLAPPPLDTPPATMQNLRDPSMLSRYDYLVIAFYFVFILSMGWIFKRFIKNTSDYFRSGGEMLWWIVGAGAFMTNFSALSFTAHAGKAYQDGPVLLVIFFGNAFAFFLNYLYFAPAFRQMRCITAMDAVRRRFGAANEQFFTWLQIPMGILQAALWLFGLAIFLYAAFGFEMKHTIMASGAVVIFITVLGGSWSTNASEFVQMLLLMPVTVVAAVFALVKIGGVHAFFERTPRHFWHWGQVADSRLIFFWTAAILLQRLIVINNMTDASRYLSVKDSRHARKAALLAGGVVHHRADRLVHSADGRARHAPEPGRAVPRRAQPAETSYFAICVSTMPIGMLGLLLSGIFASTMGRWTAA
jgi:hypothetical protein